ncbi:MAG TPA: cytochrome c [Pseudolabrys sp.]|nr:cytochrome c [Pseudolabrys sp.]
MAWKWALAAMLAAAAASSVLAQSDPIATRKGLMKGNNDNARNVLQMIRGQQPFDVAKVDAAFAQWAESAQKLPAQFPPDSKTGQKTRAAPAIWEHKADFDAKAAAFGKAVAENRPRARKSLDDLKAAFAPVNDACDNCHKDYRLSQR